MRDAVVKSSHDLILSQTTVRIRVHAISCARSHVFDKTKTERSSAILVTLELGDRSLRGVVAIEANYTSASRPSTGLILDFGLLNFADGREQLYQVFIASGPWQLKWC